MFHFTSRAPHVLVQGSLVGSWRIVEWHDAGSYGTVFRVERAGHPELGSFALKLALRPEDPRFAREATVLQRVVHPAVPRIEDTGSWTGPEGLIYPYVVMEWVEGLPLYEWGRAQPRTSADVLRVLGQLAGALAVAHAADALHRDVKGDNVLVSSEGRAVLLDWGCGTYEGARELTDTALPPGTTSYRTHEALRWGWEHRKAGAPYQAGWEDDIYSLGVTGYRLCTGTYPPLPDEGSGPQRPLLPPRELATVSEGMERLLLAALSKERRSRPPAAALARNCSAAAQEKNAALPIVPTPAAATTKRTSKPGPPPEFTVPTWLLLLGAAVLGGLVVLVAVKRTPPSQPDRAPLLVEPQWHSPSPQTPDAGVADEALASAQDVPKAVLPAVLTFGKPMPTRPFPGQRRPPCVPRVEREIVGACWLGPIKDQEPPCGDRMFDYQGECFLASYDQAPQPTSGKQ